MKKITFLILSIFTINLMGCTSSNFITKLPENIPENTQNSPPQKIDNQDQENPLQYDQMISANLNDSFKLKLGQSAQINISDRLNFAITPKKVIEDSRCTDLVSIDGSPIPTCAWSGQVLLLTEISAGNDLFTSLQITNIRPSIYKEYDIILSRVEPAKKIKRAAEGGIDFVPFDDKDYVFTFEIKKALDIEQKLPKE